VGERLFGLDVKKKWLWVKDFFEKGYCFVFFGYRLPTTLHIGIPPPPEPTPGGRV